MCTPVLHQCVRDKGVKVLSWRQKIQPWWCRFFLKEIGRAFFGRLRKPRHGQRTIHVQAGKPLLSRKFPTINLLMTRCYM